jgi:hypothetical protein
MLDHVAPRSMAAGTMAVSERMTTVSRFRASPSAQR